MTNKKLHKLSSLMYVSRLLCTFHVSYVRFTSLMYVSRLLCTFYVSCVRFTSQLFKIQTSTLPPPPPVPLLVWNLNILMQGQKLKP